MTNYKESGVEWIEQIPADWEIKRLKMVLQERNESNNPEKTNFILSLTNDRGVIPYDEKGDVGNKSKDDVTGYKLAYPNDIVLNSMNVVIGSVGISKYFGAVSPVYYMLYPRYDNDDIRYYNYIFQTREFQNKLKGYGNGIMEIRMRIQMSKLNSVEIPVPDHKQQKKIADLLDKKCEQIDKLIEIQQQEIEKLKEYKTSVITQAVTKGLDPNVPMKDSGDLCYNNIPAIWKFTKTLNMLSMPITDGPHTTPVLYDNGIEFISAEAVKNGKIDFSLIRGYISEDFYNECCAKYKPELHDIYMIKSGATTGNVAFVSEEDMKHRFNIWSPLAVFRCKKELHYKYLYYQMQSRPYNQQVQLYWSYGTQQNIGMRVLEKLKIVVPPLKEQIEIANYIDDSIIKIDILINSKQHKIEKLQEYKKSLIYEYVTGKRRVI